MRIYIEVPLALASGDCLQRTLYRFAGKCNWDVKASDTVWRIELYGITESAETLEGEFKRTLNDYCLRERVRSETEQVRTLLFAHAFSSAIPKEAC